MTYSSFIFINETVAKPKKIGNIFNDYFSTIAEKTKAKIKFSNKLNDEFLQHAKENSLFLKPASSNEIIYLISSLNESKPVGPNSPRIKILKLLKNDISLQMTIYLISLFLQESFLLNLNLLKLYQFMYEDQN